jgi:membrane protein YdbS with pleckstrin-like domain
MREPAHQVSERAPDYWRTTAAIGAVFWLVCAIGAAAAAILTPSGWWTWLIWLAVALMVLAPLPGLTFVPKVRFRIHRWEVTEIAVHVRHGWLTVVDEIVPLSRVQTVDSAQGPLMRHFGLRMVTISTASSAGIVEIACLDDALALEVVAKLVAITAATPEDAT